MSTFRITTTGTLSPVSFPDLGSRDFFHPTVSYDLVSGEGYTLEQCLNSVDIAAAIDAGYITVEDALGNPITNSADLPLANTDHSLGSHEDVLLSGLGDRDALAYDQGSGFWTPSPRGAPVSANDTASGPLLSKLVAGTGIQFTEINDGGFETLEVATTTGPLTDELGKVSSNDTTADYLGTKLVAGTGVTLTELNDGSNETLEIAATGSATDELAKVSSNDTTADYLATKIVGGSNITVTELNDGGIETLEIAATGAAADEKTKISSNDTTSDFLAAKLVAGTGVTLTELNDGSNETLRVEAADPTASVSSNDSTADYLINKVVPGANISVTEIGDGGAETLEIAVSGLADENAKVSANDTTTGFLATKIVGGSNITVTELNDGSNETLEISASGAAADEKAKVSSNDTATDFLVNKIVAGTNVTVTELNDGGVETLEIAADGGPLSPTPPVDVDKSAALAGVSTEASRRDHKHDVATAVAVEITDSTNAEGTSTSLARADHEHAHGDRGGGSLHDLVTVSVAGFMSAADKVKLDGITPGATTDIKDVKISSNDLLAGFLDTKLVAGANITLTELNDGGAETLEIAASGSLLDELAKVSANDTTADYLGTKIVAGPNITVTELNDGSNETLQISATGAATDELVRVSSNDTTADYLLSKLVAGSGVTLTELNDGAAEGIEIASPLTSTPPVDVDKSPGLVGVGTTPARHDHKHDVSVAPPVELSDSTNLEGVASSLSRSDHVHAHGNRSGGTLHAEATTSVAGFMSASDKLKLDGIESFAQVDDKDVLVSANDTTAGFLATKIVAGANVTITELNDGSNETLEIAATGGGSGLDTKAGTVVAGSFSGSPKKATITFATAYSSTAYSVTLGIDSTSNASWSPKIESKTTGGFTINLGSSNVTNLVEVSWQTIESGE